MSLVVDILSSRNVTEQQLNKIAMKKGGLVGCLNKQDDKNLFKAKLVCDFGYTTIHKPGKRGSGLSRVFLVGLTDEKKQLIERGKRSVIQKACPQWSGAVVEKYLDFRSKNSGVFFYAPFVYKYTTDLQFRSVIDKMPVNNKAGVYDNSWRREHFEYLQSVGMDSWGPTLEDGFRRFIAVLKKYGFIGI